MSRLRLWAIALAAVLVAAPGFAQGTTGTLVGGVTDDQGLALPGVAVTATNLSTGFSRSVTTDTSGNYTLPGLPVGTYEIKADLSGFAGQARKGVTVNVAGTTSADFKMAVTGRTEEVTVVAEAPLIDPKDAGVGEVITGNQIENLPLNGRQLGNLAGLVPGVSLGFHTDPTKSTQFAPQVNGGGGRNINYLIDGGDNNDDTVGGLVQNFPLDSIGEFNFQTNRFRADTGRALGGVLNVVTKSGTNELRGSVFEYFRDKSLNTLTETEKLNNRPKGDYRRHQFGGSLGGPIVRDRTHFFLSAERIQQDTRQSVSTRGLFPDKEGSFPLAYRENMAVAKVTHQVNPRHYLTLRYGFNNNTQPYGTSPLSPPESWGTNENTFHSINTNLNSVLGAGRLNEFVFQYSYFHNHIGENSTLPTETFPNNVAVGQSVNTPQTTDQRKFQFRDDLTWNRGRHELKTGVSFIYQPVLDITFNSGGSPNYTHLADSRTSPISSITRNGLIPGQEGGEVGKIPNNQYGLYVQDSWRASDKLTLDLGVRYDLVTGFANVQDGNVVFDELQAAGRAGVFQSSTFPCPCPGYEDFGKESKEDTNNIAPRLGFIYDVKADGRMIVRGGVGRYYDFAFTNANLLFPVYGAQVPFGQVYSVTNSAGIRNPDGSLFQVGQPLPPNQLTNVTRPLPTSASTPLIKQPYSNQANLGFSKSLGAHFAIEVDGVWVEGRDQGMRPRLNARVNGGPRRFTGVLPRSGGVNFRTYIQEGESRYRGLSLTLKRRWDGKLQVLGSYTLSDAKSTASRRATDEFGDIDVVDSFDVFNERQFGYVRTDARHRVTASAVWRPVASLTIAPIYRYRSKTPFNSFTGVDNNRDGFNFDLPADCPIINCRRGADLSQLDLRVSKKFRISGRTAFEVIAEGFNLLNDTNPTTFVENMTSATFGQPTRFAGDFRQGEQRLFQLGARFEF